MPQFYPEHTPPTLDAFTRGYLDCAEWLLDDDVNRDRVTGWHKDAIHAAIRDCERFQRENVTALEAFCILTGRDDSSCGHDFWLTRNGHGAGYWDRYLDVEGEDRAPAKALGEALTQACRAWRNVDTYVHRRKIHFM